MTPVACRIHDHIAVGCHAASFENIFERDKIIIAGREAEIVDKNDKFERIVAERFDQRRQHADLRLLDLDQTQAVFPVFIHDRFDGRAFSGPRISVQQRIVRFHSLKKSERIFDKQIPFPFISCHVF